MTNDPHTAIRDAMANLVRPYPEIELRDVAAFRLERPHGGATRYFLTVYIPPRLASTQRFDVYAVLFGVYGHGGLPEDFDARQWGDRAHMLLLAKLFIVELADAKVLPRFTPPDSMR